MRGLDPRINQGMTHFTDGLTGSSPTMTTVASCFHIRHSRFAIRPMRLTFTSWNINSVRLRIDLVAKFIKATRPDVLCLQETKCQDDRFPRRRFKRLGYEHVALNGQKGYHGVSVLSRVPFDTTSVRGFCGKRSEE